MAVKMATRGAVPPRLLHSPGVRFMDEVYLLERNHLENHFGMASTGAPQTDSGAPSPDLPPGTLQPASLRLRITEQRLKLLNAINVVLQQRAELEASRTTLTHLQEELKKKLKRKMDDCESSKKDNLKSMRTSNQSLEIERNEIVKEIDHLRRHMDKEMEHHAQHARAAAAQATQGAIAAVAPTPVPPHLPQPPPKVTRTIVKLAPGRKADNKLAAARLIKEITDLRQRVANIEGRLHTEIKRKKQAEADISMLRGQLLLMKAECAAARAPLAPLRINRHAKL